MAEYKEVSLYKGDVKVRFYEESHIYYFSILGSPFKRGRGVTTYIGIKDKSKALSTWQQRVTFAFLKNLVDQKKKLTVELAVEAAIQNEIQAGAAADIGKDAHAWCEAFIKNKLGLEGFEKMPEMPKKKEAVAGVNAFLAWWDGNHVEPVASEMIVYSKQHGFMGTVDFDAKVNGVRTLVDFKTSNGLYNSVRLQTRGYQLAKEEEMGKPIYKQRMALRLSKVTEEEYLEQEEQKKEIKRIMAKIRGKDFRDYEIPPYQVFEAMNLDEKDGTDHMAEDLKGFIDAVGLFEWDKKTDFFANRQ